MSVTASPAPTCATVVALTGAATHGDASAEERARVEQHLLVCPPCAVYAEQLATLRSLAQRAVPATLALGLPPALRAAFQRASGGGRP